MEASALLERVRVTSQLPNPRNRRRIRERAGISQREMAEALGVGLMTINRWERGLTRPRGQQAVAYTSLLQQLKEATA
jgi:DNA-binding transcriptional regulator YiaG